MWLEMRAKGQRLPIQTLTGLAKELDFFLHVIWGYRRISSGDDIRTHVGDVCGTSVGGGLRVGSQESNQDGVRIQVCAGELSLWQRQGKGHTHPGARLAQVGESHNKG